MRSKTGYPLSPLLFSTACKVLRASLVAQLVKNSPAMPETWVGSLGWEVPLDEKPSSILAWKISVERGAWQATVHGLQRVEHD